MVELFIFLALQNQQYRAHAQELHVAKMHTLL